MRVGLRRELLRYYASASSNRCWMLKVQLQFTTTPTLHSTDAFSRRSSRCSSPSLRLRHGVVVSRCWFSHSYAPSLTIHKVPSASTFIASFAPVFISRRRPQRQIREPADTAIVSSMLKMHPSLVSYNGKHGKCLRVPFRPFRPRFNVPQAFASLDHASFASSRPAAFRLWC